MNRTRSSLDILLSLSEDNAEFKRAVTTRAFRAGQTVAEPAVLDQEMLVLIKGRIQLVHESHNGRQIALATLEPGAVIWEGLCIKEHSTSMRAKALTDCTVWTAPSPRAKRLLLHHFTLRWGMLQTIAERMAQVEGRIKEVAFRGVSRATGWVLVGQ